MTQQTPNPTSPINDTLDAYPSGDVLKLLIVGESGTGKSGALASLAAAGYNLWVLDYDNGLSVCKSALADNPAARARFHARTIRDTIEFKNGVAKVKAPPTAYKAAGRILMEWNAQDFTPKDIIVLDTLSTFSESAFNEALFIGGRLNQRPQLQDFGWLADSVKLFIEMLTSPELNCHVIVNTHIRYFEGEAEAQTPTRGLPNAKGQEISRNVSKYFNTVLLTRTVGSGPATKRVISTQPQGVIDVKSQALNVEKTYPIETGLASFFLATLGKTPNMEPLAPSPRT